MCISPLITCCVPCSLAQHPDAINSFLLELAEAVKPGADREVEVSERGQETKKGHLLLHIAPLNYRITTHCTLYHIIMNYVNTTYRTLHTAQLNNNPFLSQAFLAPHLLNPFWPGFTRAEEQHIIRKRYVESLGCGLLYGFCQGQCGRC